MRKAIARVLTVITEKRRAAARTTHKDAKRTPRDLRHKKTRAFRRRLSKDQAKKMTLKQQKKHDNFKLKNYSLLA